MRLIELVERYVASRDVTDAYTNQLRWLSNAVSRTIGHEPTVEDLTVETVNRHLKSTRDTMTPETRKSHRRMLLTLWQAAADEGLTGEPPRRKVMQIRVPDRLQRAWNVDEVKALLIAANDFTGRYKNDVPKRLYWRSYILAAWDSGLRGCDLRKLPRRSIADDGACTLVQKKTGRMLRVRFRKATLDAIAESYPPDRDLIWGLWGRLECWRREAKRLLECAGLVGGIRQLRHSSGTAVEILHPGRGHEHLGNTRAVFERHYLDYEKIATTAVLPPGIV